MNFDIQEYKDLFSTFSLDSKVWIFPSETDLSLSQKEAIQEKISAFLSSWKAHGNQLQADFEILHNRFVVVVADEKWAQATGCSIDKLTHEMQALEKELRISLLNRMLVHYIKDQAIETMPFGEFKKNKSESMSSYFDLAVSKLRDFKTQFFLES